MCGTETAYGIGLHGIEIGHDRQSTRRSPAAAASPGQSPPPPKQIDFLTWTRPGTVQTVPNTCFLGLDFAVTHLPSSHRCTRAYLHMRRHLSSHPPTPVLIPTFDYSPTHVAMSIPVLTGLCCSYQLRPPRPHPRRLLLPPGLHSAMPLRVSPYRFRYRFGRASPQTSASTD